MDITQLILDDHHEQRRLFALLAEIAPDDPDSLTAIWTRLTAFLDLHAEAEERVFYPALLAVGQGSGGKPDAAAETTDAIKDHNEIRDAAAAVDRCETGTEAWFAAVAAADKANGEHMDEEERQGLADFRRHASLDQRHALAVKFVVFEADHVGGVAPVDKDPERWVAEHARPAPL